MMPKMSGEILTRDLDKYSHTFVEGDICSFIIQNPSDMRAKDWMWLKITKVNNAEVFVMRGKDYVYDGRPSSRTVEGKLFGMLRGKDYYVSGVSTSVFAGFFRTQTWIEITPDVELPPPPSPPAPIVTPTPTPVPTPSPTPSPTPNPTPDPSPTDPDPKPSPEPVDPTPSPSPDDKDSDGDSDKDSDPKPGPSPGPVDDDDISLP